MPTIENVTWPGWEVVRVIGSGSFGTVYEIQQNIRGYVEKAALKVITIPHNEDEVDYLRCSGLDDASITRTFQQQVDNISAEYTLVAQLRDNYNIVRSDAFREVQRDDGLGWDIYIKMELLTPLMKCLDRVSTEPQIIQLGMDICNALIACQRKNIIHRDIKPQNIFISETGNFKLGDFGIARTIERATHATAGIGTYSYMAPEVECDETYGKTVDIYSLGLTMYWLLNDRRGPFMPLPPNIPKFGDEEKARRRRFSGEPIQPPKNGSEGLKAIVLRACSFRPEDRFASAEEFYAALANLKGIPHTVSETNVVSSGGADAFDNDVTVGPWFGGSSGGADAFDDDVTVGPWFDGSSGDADAFDDDVTVGPRFDGSSGTKTNSSENTGAGKKGVPILSIVALVAVIVLLLSFCGKQKSNSGYNPQTNQGSNSGAFVPQTNNGNSAGNTHTHNWQSATCTNPKTCLSCGATEGSPAGHKWNAATMEVPKTCSVCGATEGQPLKQIAVGDTITMGYYGNESIKWIVLEYNNATRQALLISQYCIETIPFDTSGNYSTWENCTLRKWLNSNFINAAFSDAERSTILTKQISNSGGNDTSDRVFLLSYDEAVSYFPSNSSRQGTPTAYCKAQGCYDPVKYAQEHGTTYDPSEVGHTWWWLRTPGQEEKRACNVQSKGAASAYGAYKTSEEGTVRPVMWVQF